MATSKYRTAPSPTSTMPPGVPYIVGNEAAERFSYYGMKAILAVYMTEYVVNASGELDVMSEADAKVWVHTFGFGVYFIPLIGAIVSDAFWGKYRTIIALSIVYCFGHLALALDETRLGLALGLTLIAVGSGGIKPCVSAHVGDQFGRTSQHLLSKVFGWFYFSINIGSSSSQVLIPLILAWYGPRVAFGIPGLLMLLATIVFWTGRYKFVHVPPSGLGAVREAFSRDGLRAVLNLSIVFVFIAVFWSLFEQTATAWVLQGRKMEPLAVGSYAMRAEQMQALNPILVMLFIPAFNYALYPAAGRLVRLTPLRKISFGLFITACSFVASAWIQSWIDAGLRPHIGWQILPYVVLTFSEILVAITSLEFAYTQAPRKMKSFIMSLWLMAIAVGNAFTALVNYFIQNEDGTTKLTGADYYWFFAYVMAAAAVGFVCMALLYRGTTYIQHELTATDELHRV